MNKTKLIRNLLTILLVGSFFTIGLIPAAFAGDDDKLDQVTLADGRRFVGHILEEDDQTIRMKVFVRGISTTRAFMKSNILEVLHDTVAVADTEHVGDTTASSDVSSTPNADREAVQAAANGRPVVYKIPMRGLIGWEMYGENLKTLWQEAVDVGSDMVIFEFDCTEGFYDLEEYRDLIEEIKWEAKQNEIELMAWIKRAEGVAVAYALMFEDIYFQPDGFMGRGQDLDESLKEQWSDEDVRAKMISAWVGICRGMAEEGGHDALLCEAMIRPELFLAVEWRGEDPVFHASNDTNGGKWLVVDDDDEEALELDADRARNYGVSEGDARSIDDLMRRYRNEREFYVYDGRATAMTDAWVQGYDDAWVRIYDIRQDMDFIDGGNEEPKKKLGMKLNLYKEIERLLRQYPPLGKAPYGGQLYGIKYGAIDPAQVEFEIEELKRSIRSITEQEREERRQNRPGRRPGG
ncbi:MAG: hypothetical protein ACF8PN_00130 [Phycisphaerales bacterium]